MNYKILRSQECCLSSERKLILSNDGKSFFSHSWFLKKNNNNNKLKRVGSLKAMQISITFDLNALIIAKSLLEFYKDVASI